MSSPTPWPSAQGWYTRAHPHPSSAEFTPSADALAFAVLLNAQADPDGFTMALFRPDVAVDARGRILRPRPEDFSALNGLAERANHLPNTGSFMNAWRVAHDRTSQKIDRLFVKGAGGDIRETSVQCWHPEKTKLETVVVDYEDLPPVLHDLFGCIREARADYKRGEEENKLLITQVKALVQN